jgi:hypothetical protein
MRDRNFLWVAAVVFGVVALAHLLRIFNGWSLTLDGWIIPMAFSWIGGLVAAGLCLWAVSLIRSDPEGQDQGSATDPLPPA